MYLLNIGIEQRKIGRCDSWRFENLNLNETHPHFKPSCYNPTNLKVPSVILQGKIHTLTDDMCVNFPKITHYYAESIGLNVFI